MKHIILSTALALVLSGAVCSANDNLDPKAFVLEDLSRAACNRHRYEVLDSSVTAAPRGYEAFYISHIGRHGSRTNGDKNDFSVIEDVRDMYRQGVFTPEGESLLVTLETYKAEVESIGYGALTQRGAKEHRDIARRMSSHYPSVFCNPSRPNVKVYSTMVPRVIESMENFTSTLAQMYPDLAMTKAFSKQSTFNKYQVNGHSVKYDKEAATEYRHNLLRSMDCSRLIEATFLGGKVPESIKGKEASFFQRIYSACCISQTLPDEVLARIPRIESYFTQNEILSFWEYTNIKYHSRWCECQENGGAPLKGVSCIIKHIIDDADAVIAGADTCATLRFTHDTFVMPVICALGLEGSTFKGSFKESSSHYCVSYNIPMGGNVQIIFYRNVRGNVLVKFLNNERETTIPAIKASKNGIFYDWDVVKKWLESRL